MRKKQKKLDNLQKTLNWDSAPGKQMIGSSFVRQKSCQICKMLLKSPQKAISILKHLWNQLYKSPRKRKIDLIDHMWSKDKEFWKYIHVLSRKIQK